MNCVIASIHANAESEPGPEADGPSPGERKPPRSTRDAGAAHPPLQRPGLQLSSLSEGRPAGKESDPKSARLRVHQFPVRAVDAAGRAVEFVLPPADQDAEGGCSHEDDPERRVYRRRTVAMLRRYMRYSIETGRLPSVLGGEFFRAKVTSYTVVTFEDRVIFVHDMEICLQRLDEFSQQLIARHILQEHDHEGTARLLHCNEKTVRRLVPMVLDLLSDILLEVGLLESLGNRKKSCQGGPESQIALSRCEDGENKF